VYVADNFNHRIQKFDSNGTFVTQWGSFGSADGQFGYPWDIAVDSSGYVYVTYMYVADNLNHTIQKFDSNGTFVTKCGSEGTGDGQFTLPQGIAVDSSGYVYVADYGNSRIQKFKQY
jgi:DNA-binding beta-propeller fold protein YncE